MERFIPVPLDIKPSFYSNGVPVFEPTMEEFQDFYLFNKAVNKYGMQSGIIKIIPPIQWTCQLHGTYTHDNLSKISIRNPIVQNMNVTPGFKGVYSSHNLEKQKKYLIFQWKQLAERNDHATPKACSRRKQSVSTDERLSPNNLEEGKGENGLDGSSVTPDGPSNPTDIQSNPIDTERKRLLSSLLSGDFNIDVSSFTTENCKRLEELYWKSLSYAEPMYGADVLGSVFLTKLNSWNISQLPNILDLMDEKIPGVNDAYLYAGLWKATFSWHLEDQDLYSINYIHFGAPKQWYSIPQAEASRFYDLMKSIFNEDYRACTEFLRHKTFLASPQFLRSNGITCNSVVHNQGEFIITYPYGYHAGFNYGFNLAESVNFALDDWFEFAKMTKRCRCITDSVAINCNQLYCRFMGIPYNEPNCESVESCPISEEKVIKKSKPGPKKQKVAKCAFECVLCPNNLPPALKQYKPFQLVDTEKLGDNGNYLQAHRVCAMSFLELKFRKKGRRDVFHGLDLLPRSVHSLRCLLCHTPNQVGKKHTQGACVKCLTPKCTRSYHATCAIASGFELGGRSCKMHRGKTSPYFEQKNEEFHARLSKMSINTLVQFSQRNSGKRHTGDVFCGIIQENSPNEHTLTVQVYPNLHEAMEVHYDDVILGISDKPSYFDDMKVFEDLKVTQRPSRDVLVSESDVNDLLVAGGSVSDFLEDLCFPHSKSSNAAGTPPLQFVPQKRRNVT